MQGVAAGLMTCISFVDLLPASIEAVGFAQANLWFYGGVLFFASIVAFIPEPSAADAYFKTAELEAESSEDERTQAEKENRQKVSWPAVLLFSLLCLLWRPLSWSRI